MSSKDPFLDDHTIKNYAPDPINLGNDPLSSWGRRFEWTEHWRGWRVSVAAGATLSFVIFIINVSLLGWSLKQRFRSDDDVSGTATIFKGDCDQAGDIFTWSHLAINAMSTLLLSASTVGIQCSSALTRTELDKAHRSGQWVHVGVIGYRNIHWIKTTRRVIWAALLISSLPLHLVYNSVVYPEYSANDYEAHYVAENFVTEPGQKFYDTFHQKLYDSIAHRTRFEKAECIDTFNVKYVTTYRDVLVVLDTVNSTNPVLQEYDIDTFGPEYEDSSGLSWICTDQDFCESPGRTPKDKEHWVVRVDNPMTPDNGGLNWQTYSVLYCLAEPIEAQCTVVVGTTLLALVMIGNVVKVICLGYLATLGRRGFKPLITVGDAVASFLADDDPTTIGEGAFPVDLAKNWTLRNRKSEPRAGKRVETPPKPHQPWSSKRRSWANGSGLLQWIACDLWCVALVTTASFLFFTGDRSPNTQSGLWQKWKAIGFGYSPQSQQALLNIADGKSVLNNVLLVNTPQLLVSVAYVLYNTLLTDMSLTAEYSKYAHHRRPLRVSEPVGEQRSTYWLSLPYRYALPLMISMGVLHWLISQSIFLVRIRMVETATEKTKLREIASTCGFSPIAIIASIVLGVAMIIALHLIGSRKYSAGMPLLSSCSVAISAASHRSEKDEYMSFCKALKYGVTGTNEDGTRRVGFSAAEVEPLWDGDVYK